MVSYNTEQIIGEVSEVVYLRPNGLLATSRGGGLISFKPL